jgi:uncharacterized membrane protein YbhN (UPF0104 family)
MLTRPAFWDFISRFAGKFACLASIGRHLPLARQTFAGILTLKSMLLIVPLSALSWAGEGFALYMALSAMGVAMPGLLSIAIFAHALGAIAGAVSFIPGGLLATEGVMGTFFVCMAVPQSVAVSATFMIRVATLWFAVFLGLVVFMAGYRPADLQNPAFEENDTVAFSRKKTITEAGATCPAEKNENS